jgi:hypothetical protein
LLREQKFGKKPENTVPDRGVQGQLVRVTLTDEEVD